MADHDQRPHRFEVAFGPQRIAGWSFAASAAGLALVVVLLSGWRPRGVREGAPPAPVVALEAGMSARAVLGRVLLVGVLWLLGGGRAGRRGRVRRLRPGQPAHPGDLLVIAVLLLGLVPLVVLARGLPAADAVGPASSRATWSPTTWPAPAWPCWWSASSARSGPGRPRRR